MHVYIYIDKEYLDNLMLSVLPSSLPSTDWRGELTLNQMLFCINLMVHNYAASLQSQHLLTLPCFYIINKPTFQIIS